MASNVRAFSGAGCPSGGAVTHGEFNVMDVNAAQAVNRNSTASGYRNMAIRPICSIGASAAQLCKCVPGKLITFNVATDDLFLELDELPHGHTLDQVTIRVLPSGGHSSSAPAALPKLSLIRLEVGTSGSYTMLASQTYTWINETTYELGFALGVSSLGEVIDRYSYRYQVQFQLESGSNSIAALAIFDLRAKMLIDHAYAGTDISIWV